MNKRLVSKPCLLLISAGGIYTVCLFLCLQVYPSTYSKRRYTLNVLSSFHVYVIPKLQQLTMFCVSYMNIGQTVSDK